MYHKYRKRGKDERVSERGREGIRDRQTDRMRVEKEEMEVRHTIREKSNVLT